MERVGRIFRGLRERIWIPLSFVFVVGMAVFLLAWGEPEARAPVLLQPSAYEEPPEIDDSVLQVVQAAPQGLIGAADLKREIFVVFNHPLQPLAALEKKTSGVFRITPHLPGRFRWYGSRICAFIPDNDFRPGTGYRIVVSAGLKSLNGRVLEKDYRFDFSTPRLKLLYHRPSSRERISYNPEIALIFNFPVRLNELKKNLRIHAGGRGYPFSLAYPRAPGSKSANRSRGEPERKKTVLVRIGKTLPRDARVELFIGRNVRPIDGNRGMKLARQISFQTYGPLEARIQGSPRYFQNMWDLQLHFNNPVDAGRAVAALQLSPPAPLTRSLQGKVSRLPLTSWRLSPVTEYTIRLDPNLRDWYGNALRGGRTFTFRTPAYRPAFSTESGHIFIESEMEQKIPVNVTALEGIDVQLGELKLENIQKKLENYRYDIFQNIDSRRTMWPTGAGSGRPVTRAFDLRPHLSASHRGWRALQFTAMVPSWNGRKKIRRRFQQFIQSTDLGLTVKQGSDFAQAWVHSLDRATPRRNVLIRAFDGGRPLGRCSTDARGMCRIRLQKNEPIKKALYVAETGEGGGDRAFVTVGNHEVYVWGPDIHHDYNPGRPRALGQVLFDRKLYRPGDEVGLKAFLALRERGGLGPLQAGDAEVRIVVRNSQGGEILNERRIPSQEGGVDARLTVPAEAPLGHYNVRIVIKNKSRLIEDTIYDTFQVEEFRPVAFAVTLTGARTSRVGERIKMRVGGRYLFGAPMQDLPVSWVQRRRATTVSFRGYSGYLFGEESRDYFSRELWDYAASGQGRLNRAGEYEFKLPLTAYPPRREEGQPREELSRIFDVEIESRVRDADDREVTTRREFRVFPGRALYGIRVRDRFGSVKKPFAIDLIALDNAGHPVGRKQSARLVVEHESWKSVQTRGPGGSRQVRNRRVVKTVLDRRVSLDEKPYRYRFRAPQSGSYIVTLRDRRGHSYSRLRLYAFGGGFSAWNYYDDDRVTLLPDRKSYSPGDTAKVVIQSPFSECLALVTVERENVLYQKTVHFKKGMSPLEIPIKKEYLPNVYLSVMLITPRLRDVATEKRRSPEHDPGLPRFKMGAVALKVSPDSRRARLEIQSDRQDYAPGAEVELNIQTEPGAEIALTAADRGVLDLIQYRYADPLQTFYRNWPLSVKALENRRYLLEQLAYTRKGDAPGGGGDDGPNGGGFAYDSEDGARKNFRYTAYWNPQLRADGRGRLRIKFRLPDNLTTFRIMALAARDGKFATRSHEIRVRRALVVRPVTPRFIRPGDRLSMGAVLINQTGKDAAFRLDIQAPLLSASETGGPLRESRIVRIPAGGTREVTVPVVADTLRLAKTRAKLKSGAGGSLMIGGTIKAAPADPSIFRGGPVAASEARDSVVFKFPVQEHMPAEAFAIGGVAAGRSEEGIVIPGRDRVQGDAGGMRVSFSTTALAGLGRGFAFYASNPYFCLEQRASAYLLMLTSGELLKKFQYRAPDKKGYDFTEIERLFLDELPRFQNADGGFRFWSRAGENIGNSYPYLTAQVLDVLQFAGARSRRVEDRILQGARRYLHNYIRRPGKDSRSYILETGAMIYEVLARGGEDVDSLESVLLANEKNLSLRARAHLALGLARRRGLRHYSQDPDTSRLFAGFRNAIRVGTRSVTLVDKSDAGRRRAFASTGSTLGVVLRAYMELDSKNPLLPGMVSFILSGKKAGLWDNSHAAGSLARGLWEFHERYERPTAAPDFMMNLKMGNNTLLEKRLGGKTDLLTEIDFPLKRLYQIAPVNKPLPLTFETTAGGRLYYTALLQYAPVPERAGPRDEGLEVKREVFPLAAPGEQERRKSVSDLTRGEMYLVRLTVVNPKPRFQVLLSDPVPSNVEIVNAAFAVEGSGLRRFLGKKRGAEGGYWWAGESARYEYRDTRAIITQNYLSPGVHEYFYLIRPVVRGRAFAPPARAFLMYEPEVFGRGESGFRIVR